MSMRPGEKVLAAPEELGLDSRTAFRRAATELLEQLQEVPGVWSSTSRHAADRQRRSRCPDVDSAEGRGAPG